MAVRRRPGAAGGPRPSTFNEEFTSPNNHLPSPAPPDNSSSSSSTSSLAAKAIRASSAYRDPSLSSAYGQSALPPSQNPNFVRSYPPSVPKDSATPEYTPLKNLNEPKHGFWGGLARKAKAILDDDNDAQQSETPGRTRPQMPNTDTRSQYHSPYHSQEGRQKTENPALQKGLGAISSSLSYIGGTIGNAFEEGLNIVENRTADIIQETRKLQIRKKGSSSEKQKPMSNVGGTRQQPLMQTHVQPQMQTDLEIQLKASRDVAMAMAAKAKLLLRELKTVKADLAFAKDRCGQLEEENRILRESLENGDNPEDDDLIRLQLESLLAEKARLAQENSVFARENRFLREIVEYHQLTMQDVVYLDEGSEEVTEVYPMKVPPLSNTHSVGAVQTTASPSSPIVARNPQVISTSVTPLSSFIHLPKEENLETRSDPA